MIHYIGAIMKESTYKRIIDLIDECGTWIKVADDNAYKVCRIRLANGISTLGVCPVLVLRSQRAAASYHIGQLWEIARDELDHAVTTLKKREPDFRIRLQLGDDQLTAADAEEIIRLASHETILLNLKKQFKEKDIN